MLRKARVLVRRLGQHRHRARCYLFTGPCLETCTLLVFSSVAELFNDFHADVREASSTFHCSQIISRNTRSLPNYQLILYMIRQVCSEPRAYRRRFI